MKPLFQILRSAKPLKKYYFIISLLTVLLSLLSLLQPLLTGLAVDQIRKGADASIPYLLGLAVAIFPLDLCQNLFSNISGYFGDQMSQRLQKFLSGRYYEHLLTLPQAYFDTELSGKIIGRLNRSISQITNFIQTVSNNFLQFIFGTLFALIAVAIYSWQVALLLFALYPIYIWMTFRTSNVWQQYQQDKNQNLDIASGRFAESVGQIKVVKSFLQERRELSFFNKHLAATVRINQPQSRYWHVNDVRRRLVLNVIFLGVYVFIFLQGAHGNITPGQAVALILYSMQIRIPIFTISFLVESTQRAIADSKDYFEVMRIQPAIVDLPNAKKLHVKAGDIRFSDVSFAYDKKPVLTNLNFSIEANKTIALVGESGQGKTTLTNLLMRLYEPNSGAITIDGQDISRLTQASLRHNIGVVFQEASLFSGTIYENIAYADPAATEAAVTSAAKAANAHQFIKAFEKGYQTEIGERGLKLSGGQKQRIAIARAILKNAPILILDEATSSLDSKSEVAVQDALQHLMKGRTTIIIAHRLSTIQQVDTIVTLKNGTVNEIGSPAELAGTNGIYAQLLALQNIGKADKESAQQSLKKYDMQLQ